MRAGFLAHIEACNRWDRTDFLPWRLGGEVLGWLRPAFADALVAASQGAFARTSEGLCWQIESLDPQPLSAALAGYTHRLHEQGVLPTPQGEAYPVTPGRRDQSKCVIDRAYAPWFGTRAFGQHLNGYVRGPEGLELWVARRAANRRHYPNCWDNTVAGGLPDGISLRENLRKECYEEAGLAAQIADQARSVSAVSYCRATRAGLKPDIMYCYDLELSADQILAGTDGEVAAFERWPVARVLETVRDTEAFKLNCNLVIIDFLIRHGLITPEHPDYFELIRRLRSPLPDARADHSSH